MKFVEMEKDSFYNVMMVIISMGMVVIHNAVCKVDGHVVQDQRLKKVYAY